MNSILRYRAHNTVLLRCVCCISIQILKTDISVVVFIDVAGSRKGHSVFYVLNFCVCAVSTICFRCTLRIASEFVRLSLCIHHSVVCFLLLTSDVVVHSYYGERVYRCDVYM